jgi:hypothetical protein
MLDDRIAMHHHERVAVSRLTERETMVPSDGGDVSVVTHPNDDLPCHHLLRS